MSEARIHVLFCPSAGGSLRQVIGEDGCPDEVICLEDNLSYGRIDSLDPDLRYDALLKEGLADEKGWNWLPGSSREFWERCAATKRRRIVWFSKRSPREMAGFLAYMHRFGDSPCDMVNLEEGGHLLSRRDGQPLGIAFGTGELSLENIRALIKCARPVSTNEVASAGQLWEQLVRENAPLRIPGGAGLVSAPANLVDDCFISECSNEWKSTARVLASVLISLPDERGFALDQFFLESRLVSLLAEGVLESRADSIIEKRDRFRDWAWIRLAEA